MDKNQSDSIKKQIVKATILNWMLDNIWQKSYQVNLDGVTQKYIKVPGNQYISPYGKTDRLVQESGYFKIIRRFGEKLIFNAKNYLVKRQDVHGLAYSYAYNNDNTLRSVSDAGGRRLNFEYSGDKLVRVNDSLGRGVSYEYRGDLLTSFVGVTGQRINYIYEYNDLGQLIARINRKGQKTQYSYTGSGRTKQIVYPNSSKILYNYDKYDRVISMTDKIGVHAYQYDNFDNIVQKTDGHGYVIKYEYDRYGNRTKLTYPKNTKEIEYVYDEYNRLEKIKNWHDQEYLYQYDI